MIQLNRYLAGVSLSLSGTKCSPGINKVPASFFYCHVNSLAPNVGERFPVTYADDSSLCKGPPGYRTLSSSLEKFVAADGSMSPIRVSKRKQQVNVSINS